MPQMARRIKGEEKKMCPGGWLLPRASGGPASPRPLRFSGRPHKPCETGRFHLPAGKPPGHPGHNPPQNGLEMVVFGKYVDR